MLLVSFICANQISHHLDIVECCLFNRLSHNIYHCRLGYKIVLLHKVFLPTLQYTRHRLVHMHTELYVWYGNKTENRSIISNGVLYLRVIMYAYIHVRSINYTVNTINAYASTLLTI